MSIFYATERDPDRNLRLGTIDDNERLVIYRAGSAQDVVHDMTRRGCDRFEVHPVTSHHGAVDVDLLPVCNHQGQSFTLLDNGQIKCRCGAIEGAPRRVGGYYG